MVISERLSQGCGTFLGPMVFALKKISQFFWYFAMFLFPLADTTCKQKWKC